MPNGDDPQPIGMPLLRQLLIFAAVAAFIVIYYVALRKVWTADDGKVPQLDGLLVGAAAGLNGALGAGFALAMGVETAKPPTDRFAQVLGPTALPKINWASWALTLGVWAYAGVGGAAMLTYALHQKETPRTSRRSPLCSVAMSCHWSPMRLGPLEGPDMARWRGTRGRRVFNRARRASTRSPRKTTWPRRRMVRVECGAARFRSEALIDGMAEQHATREETLWTSNSHH
jgi:hypothetical protein